MASSYSPCCTVSIDFSIDRLDDTVVELTEAISKIPLMITVHLAYAEDIQQQHYMTLQVVEGTTLYEALEQAGWLAQFPNLALWCQQVVDIKTPAAKLWHVGIYAQKQPTSYILQPLDRIEVYRSLSADPMSQRKSRGKKK
ncbi:hypothetical protein AK823_01730 [Psychrobacter sp. P2G3]|nr:hypothetical protein AK823_01730 [Psychrobacter sp. P2G3]